MVKMPLLKFPRKKQTHFYGAHYLSGYKYLSIFLQSATTKKITEWNTQGTKSTVITGNETIWHIFLPYEIIIWNNDLVSLPHTRDVFLKSKSDLAIHLLKAFWWMPGLKRDFWDGPCLFSILCILTIIQLCTLHFNHTKKCLDSWAKQAASSLPPSFIPHSLEASDPLGTLGKHASF